MKEQKHIILIPVFNDWIACCKMFKVLNSVLLEHHIMASILIVNDGSTIPKGESFAKQIFGGLSRIDVLELRRNIGHQRAISVGLAYVESNIPCESVIVMDSDGEDNPRDIPRLLEKYEQESRGKIVFAERSQRSERWTFRVFYTLYKILYRLLTGHHFRVGNFSVIPGERLRSLVVVPELWNHYAAAVFSSRQPYCSIQTARAKRVDGSSKMNFASLVIHGLSAISVFSEKIGARLLLTTTLLIFLSMGGILSVFIIKLFTDLAIPGWATFTTGLLLIVLLHAIMLAVVFSFITLNKRNDLGFLPLRDYVYFVDRLETLKESL